MKIFEENTMNTPDDDESDESYKQSMQNKILRVSN